MSRDHRASDELAADVDHVPCPSCGVEAGKPCVRNGGIARVPCHRRIRAACPKAAEHTTEETHPDLYHAWRERPQDMARDYRQAQCEGCGGWVVWVRKEQP